MAWTYLVESVELHLGFRNGSGRSHTAKSTLTPKVCSSAEWPTTFFPVLPSGTTSELLPVDTSRVPWMLLQEDSRARISALQAVELAWRVSGVDFSLRSCASPMSYDPDSSSWKMSQQSLFGDSAPSRENWQGEGMTVAGRYYPLRTSARRTCGNDGGCSPIVPTPTAQSYGTNHGGATGKVGPVRPSLETMARHNRWPTPRASDGEKGGPNQRGSKGDLMLASAVHQRSQNGSSTRWPTPASCTGNGGAHGLDGGAGSREMLRKNTTEEEARGMACGQLNPTWVEWLMGYPPGWTVLEDWAMQWFRSVRGKRSKS